MCAILGLLHLREPVTPQVIGRMAHVMRHRGPDDEGFLAVDLAQSPLRPELLRGDDSRSVGGSHVRDAGAANLYLGHRRLSILDLSINGHQPMSYGEGLWLVFNGEIYNYLELRAELEAAGHRFRSTSDTEVILAAYAHWGERCVERFNGDWALCILDAQRRTLFLSRDRFGVKPLFYFHENGRFGFASELKALLTVPGVACALDPHVVQDYLSLFVLDHGEQTFFEGLRRLLPAHSMTVGLDDGAVRMWKYYTLETNLELGTFDRDEANAHARKIRELLTDAVRIRLRADVPIGTCLSGGLDSSAVAALTAEISGRTGRQLLFTACFPGEAMDEEKYARAVQEYVGASGHRVYPTGDGCRRELSVMTGHQDEPFGGAGLYSQWSVMHEASKHVKVVLDGQGGDEVFGGYRNHRLAYLAQLSKAGRVIEMLREAGSLTGKSASMGEALAELKSLPLFFVPGGWTAALQEHRARQQMGSLPWGGSAREAQRLHLRQLFAGNINAQLAADMTVFTLPHLLRFEDRNSMAHSIEARVPFTDHRLVNHLFAIPGCYKIHNGWTKYLLRLAVQDLLPSDIVWRVNKIGFSAPPWVSRRDIWTNWLQLHRFPDTAETGSR